MTSSFRGGERLPAEAEPPFEVTTIPIGRFVKYAELKADEAAANVVKLLVQLGATEIARGPLPVELTRKVVVDELLSAWASDDRPANSMLYWVGHGESNLNGAWLAVYDTDSPMRGSSCIKPDDLGEVIANQWARRRRDDGTWSLVVIEACGAKRFVELLKASLLLHHDKPEQLALVGVGGHGQSHLGNFATALQAALKSFTDNDDKIKLLDLLGEVHGRLVARTLELSDLTSAATFPRQRVLPGRLTAPFDIYKELQSFLSKLPADERGHFVPKAQGAEQGELAWYFAGRERERQEICDWLRTEKSGMLVVTGRAGAGKSALLGNILVHRSGRLRELLVRGHFIDDLAESQRPPDNAFSEVVHLTGLTIAELVQRLLFVVGDQQPGATVSESLEQLIVLLRDREQPFSLLADALDESQEPASIAASVLQRIAAQPGCRVVVGTRKSTKEGPDQPDTIDENLLDALGRGERTRIIEVPRDPAAIGKYVRRRLGAAQPDRLPESAPIDDIAELIQAQPSRQFLYARLAVHEILAQPELVHTENRGRLNALLAHDHHGLFAQAVARLSALSPANEALLEALAMSLGRGLPRVDRIWAIVAGALSSREQQTRAEISAIDIDRILVNAAPYIMLDAEDGQSVYRLAHRTFQEHFLGRTGYE